MRAPPKRSRNASAVATSGKQNRATLPNVVFAAASANWNAVLTMKRIDFLKYAAQSTSRLLKKAPDKGVRI
jgi:hypothetical protein